MRSSKTMKRCGADRCKYHETVLPEPKPSCKYTLINSLSLSLSLVLSSLSLSPPISEEWPADEWNEDEEEEQGRRFRIPSCVNVLMSCQLLREGGRDVGSRQGQGPTFAMSALCGVCCRQSYNVQIQDFKFEHWLADTKDFVRRCIL